MMDPIQRRKIGISTTLLALVFLGVSVTASLATAVKREAVSSQIAATDQDCKNRLQILGAESVVMSENELSLKWSSLEGGYARIGEASAAAMACPGWVMKAFCIGQECRGGEVTMTLYKVQ